MTTRLQGLTGATLPSVPTVCHECVFWQSKSGKRTSKRKWIEKAEDEWGAWGTVYVDDDGRVLGSMQYGPSDLFPRAADLPGGPPSDDAVLVTCAYLVEGSAQWVMQSLFLSAIADVKERGGKALEAFAYGTPRASRRTNASWSIGRSSRMISWRTSGLAPSAASGEWSSPGSSWAGSCPLPNRREWGSSGGSRRPSSPPLSRSDRSSEIEISSL